MVKGRISKFHATASRLNQDEEYLFDEYIQMADGFKSSFMPPTLSLHEGRLVVREDLLDVGSKARMGELLVSRVKQDRIVYVQPRFGFAGVSLTKLCKMYGKKLTLFMPASKEISEHQAWCIEHGCDYKFVRIAAMPNLNILAHAWAKEKGAFFVPLGLRHPLVTAMIIKTCLEDIPVKPGRFITAFSTGVLNRALQIAWPKAKATGVAVARNIHEGERGRAEIIGHYKSFSSPCDKDKLPPFESAINYDAKVWEFTKPGDLFWNVAGNLRSSLDKQAIYSNVDWK